MQVADKPRPDLKLPSVARATSLTPEGAKLLTSAITSVAPDNTLDATRVELYGGRLRDIQHRGVANPRLTAFTRSMIRQDPVLESLPDVSTGVGDRHMYESDQVFSASGNPGTLATSLGNLSNQNDFPVYENKLLGLMRKVPPALYRGFVPGFIQEMQGRGKGRKYLLEGAADSELTPDLVVPALRDQNIDRRSTRNRLLLNTFGGPVGALIGAGIPLAGILAAAHQMQNQEYTPGSARAIAGAARLVPLGGILGAGAGIALSSMVAQPLNERLQDAPGEERRAMSDYVRAVAERKRISRTKARELIEQWRARDADKKLFVDKTQLEGETSLPVQESLRSGSGANYPVAGGGQITMSETDWEKKLEALIARRMEQRDAAGRT